MAVYFVYRCGSLGPTSLYSKRFDGDATVLDWFRTHWRPFADFDLATAYLTELLGVEVYSIGNLYFDREGLEVPRPESPADVLDAASRTYHNAIRFEEHCLQVLTDDDETDLAFYFFDDVFLVNHRDLAAYVLRDDWRLPDGEGGEGWTTGLSLLHELRGDGPGSLYTARLDPCGGRHLGDGFAVHQIEGLRVPDVCRWLMRLPEPGDDFDYYFAELRAVLLGEDFDVPREESSLLKALQDDPDDDVTWAVYADWTQEHGLREPGLRLLELALPRVCGSSDGDAARNLVQAGRHVAQSFVHEHGEDFEHWFFFDDLWASAHPALADALLRYTGWDMLSTGDERRFE